MNVLLVLFLWVLGFVVVVVITVVLMKLIAKAVLQHPPPSPGRDILILKPSSPQKKEIMLLVL